MASNTHKEEFIEELEVEEEDFALNELDFNEGTHYLDTTTNDQAQDIADYWDLLDNGVDETVDDILDGFQIDGGDDTELL